jgi:hypothetical protein
VKGFQAYAKIKSPAGVLDKLQIEIKVFRPIIKG